MVKEQHPSAVSEATTSVLPTWLNAFQVLLAIDPQEDVANNDSWDGLAVKTEIYRVGPLDARSLSEYLTP